MLWGKDLGCDFAKKSCLTWMKANRENPYPFCNVMDDSRCSANRLSKVRCNLVESMEGVPDEYDYNIPNLYKNRKGKAVTGYGQVEAGDFCPYYRTYGGVSREDSDTRCTFPDNMNYNNYSLETVCKDNRLHIKTQNSKFYPCYQGGQLIHVEKRVHGVGTVTAKIVCPSCTELCGRQYCAPDKNFKARIGDPTREAIRSHAKFIIIMFLVVPILH
uniref:Leishmanolysin-like peptidase n=1 Tax=Angiostrongylus cantonensis TaxID=6313 RepID=A0A0K0D271_ANGCA